MRVLSMHLLLKREQKSLFLKSVYELSFISFMKRGTLKDSLNFGARTCVNRMTKLQSIKLDLPELENLIVWAHIDDRNIASVIVTEKDYPESAAKIVLKKLVKEFHAQYPKFDEDEVSTDQNLSLPKFDEFIQKYQNPEEADKLLKVEKDLSEINTIMNKTMKDMLERGENLDDLVKQSEDISFLAKQFHEKSRKANTKCCSIY